MKPLILIIAILLSTTINAKESTWRVGTFLGSEHWGMKDVSNEDHTGSLYGCLHEWCAGFYENSYSDNSQFIAKNFTIGHWKLFEFTAQLGLATGYDEHVIADTLLPFAGVAVQIPIIKLWQMGNATAWGIEVTSQDARRWGIMK